MLKLVPTPIGNISDISFRAIEALSEADALLCEDTRVTKKLISILEDRFQAKFKENQTFISLHSHNEEEFISNLDVSFFDRNVVYVSDAGMPGISDPGQKLVNYCLENTVKYDILTGANAVLVAFIASGFVDTKMLFFGFLNHGGELRKKGLREALFCGYTVVLYESPKRLLKLLEEIEKIDASRDVFVAKELSKKYQKYYRGKARDIIDSLQDNIRGEWVIVIKQDRQENISAISEIDILELDISKKAKVKLICKITDENTKECYKRVLNL